MTIKCTKTNKDVSKHADNDTVASAASTRLAEDDDDDDDRPVCLEKTRTSCRVSVKRNDFCRLAYYMNCISSLLTVWERSRIIIAGNYYTTGDDSKPSASWAKLIDYMNAHNLPEQDKDTLLRLVTQVFSPEAIVGRLILRDPSLVLDGWLSNDFFNVQQGENNTVVLNGNKNTSRVVQACVKPTVSLPGCRTRKVCRLMVYRKHWLEFNYYSPIRRQKDRVDKLTLQEQGCPRDKTIPECIVTGVPPSSSSSSPSRHYGMLPTLLEE